MINDLAAKLIYDLRHDAHTREHFSINEWIGTGTCNTVGCIAGTAIIRAASKPTLAAAHDELFQTSQEAVSLKFGEDHSYGYVGPGALVLGLPNILSAQQLFMPGTYWSEPLSLFGKEAEFLTGLSHNERPDLSTVEKMVAFARSLPHDAYHPTHCANTLENLLKHERAYVDWAESYEPA